VNSKCFALEVDVNVEELQKIIRKFVAARGWEKFHNPKNLSMALSVEASELLEIFQWLTPDEAAAVTNDPEKMQKIRDEMADVMVYLLRMADALSVDLEDAVKSKMEKNIAKYPSDRVFGSAKKYNEYKD
jgi:dCTP diphosphatase